jgi:hypothetical protein
MCQTLTFRGVWLGLAVVLLIVFMLLGVGIANRPEGILIDSRGRFSLSRLQLVLWTLLLISALGAAAYTFSTADIRVPNEVLALMGISMGSTAGAVIVKGTKANQDPAASVTQNTFATMRRGVLATNATPAAARWSDLFMGEELINQNYVDLSKVQMFFFTLAVLLAYAGVLWNLTGTPGSALAFPALSSSMVTLLGISHAGYLTIKAAPKTPTSNP